jgi:hypothetical protein
VLVDDLFTTPEEVQSEPLSFRSERGKSPLPLFTLRARGPMGRRPKRGKTEGKRASPFIKGDGRGILGFGGNQIENID